MVYLQGGVDVRVTGRRIVATLLDGILLGFAYRLLTWVFHAHYTSDLDLTRLTSRSGAGGLLFAFLYYVVLEGFFGRTVGKALTGIKVISARTGRPPGVFSAIARTLLRVIDGVGGYFLAFIIVVLNDRRRRLGDMAGNTLVIRS